MGTPQEPEFGWCDYCGLAMPVSAIWLSRLFEHFAPASNENWAPPGVEWVGIPSNGEAFVAYCSESCWSESFADIKRRWHINFEDCNPGPPERRCSRCGDTFDGQTPHLVLSLSHDRIVADGGIVQDWVNDIAAFCNGCMGAVADAAIELTPQASTGT